MASIRIIPEKCVGCKLCVASCPFGAIKVVNKKAVIMDNCTLCGGCVCSCKFFAIDFIKDEMGPSVDLSAYKGVWIFAEQMESIASNVALELLGEGRKLADKLGVELSAVLIGEQPDSAAQVLIAHGADNVYVVDDPTLRDFNDESYTDVFAQLIRTY